MRIGIDCKTILNTARGEYAGVGHYTHYLVKSLIALDRENQYVLFFYDRDLDTKEYQADNVTIVKVPGARFKKYLPFVYSHIFAPFFYYWHKLDVLHVPAPIRPLLYWKKNVVTVHDLAIYRNLNWFPKLKFFFSRVLVPSSIKRADKIIAVSQNTATDIEQIFKIDKNKIALVYEGVEVCEKRLLDPKRREYLESLYPYFFYVGTIEPRKNIANLIDGFGL